MNKFDLSNKPELKLVLDNKLRVIITDSIYLSFIFISTHNFIDEYTLEILYHVFKSFL